MLFQPEHDAAGVGNFADIGPGTKQTTIEVFNLLPQFEEISLKIGV